MSARCARPRQWPPDPPAVRRSAAIGGCDGVAIALPGRPIDRLMWNAAVCATLPTTWGRAGATIGP
jgi:hypothetical protein